MFWTHDYRGFSATYRIGVDSNWCGRHFRLRIAESIGGQMTKEEAIKTIEEFGRLGGKSFVDGVKAEGVSNNDLFIIAENCRLLMEKWKEDKKQERRSE